MRNLKHQVVKGAVWAMLEKLGLQAVHFGVTLVLARLLTPTDYGTVALLSIFLGIAGSLSDCGFGRALVQKKNATDADFNSVFYISMVLSGIMYASLFCCAPLIAQMYKTPELCPILRVLGAMLLLNCINSVQNAELNRKLLFKLSFKISLIQAMVSAGVGISLAYLKYGPWALVWSQVGGGVAGTISRWFIIAWRPKFMFDWGALGQLFSFGWRMSLSGLLDSAYSNLSGALIGKFYTKADLAFVDKGKALPGVGMGMITGPLMRVSFPAMAQLQDDYSKARDAMRRMIQCSTFVVFPAMVGCAVCTETLIPLMFGNQWIPSIPYMQIICFSMAFYPFHVINLQTIAALGRSDLFLKLEIIKKIYGLILLALSLPHGVFCFVAVGAFVSCPLSLIVNSWPNRKLLKYTIAQQIMDVLPTAAISFAMGGVVWLSSWVLAVSGIEASHGTVIWYMIVKVVGQFCVGVGAYLCLAIVFKLKPLNEFLSLIDEPLKAHAPNFRKHLCKILGGKDKG